MRTPYLRAAKQAAKRNGIPIPTFLKLVNQESGWQAGIVSSAGAQGLTQLMPGTARSLGVTDEFDPVQNLAAGARYLRQQLDRFGSMRLALAGYNAGPGNVENGDWERIPETNRYVQAILGSPPGQTISPSGGITRAALAAVPVSATLSSTPVDPLWGTDLLSKTAYENLGKIAQGWSPTSTMDALVQASQVPVVPPSALAPAAPGRSLLPAPPLPPVVSQLPARAPTQPPRAAGPKMGKIVIAPGADRPGVPTQKAVLDFAARIAELYGRPLTIGTGSNPNQFVVGTHRQSAHWTGRAADIPMAGDALTKLGQDALIAAGMGPAEARQQRGGVYNIGDYQILFNTYVGGDHYNHLHIGLRG